MKRLLSMIVFVVGTLLIAKFLLNSATIGHWINGLNYSDGFMRWRVRHRWIGVESEEELWTYICLAIGAMIALPASVVLYRRIR